jgi:hypothetical protein
MSDAPGNIIMRQRLALRILHHWHTDAHRRATATDAIHPHWHDGANIVFGCWPDDSMAAREAV